MRINDLAEKAGRSVDAGFLSFEKGHEVSGKGGPVAPKHSRTLHFEENFDKTKTSQEEEKIGLSL